MVSTLVRFEVWLVNLHPTVGAEIRKTQPALIVSPEADRGGLGEKKNLVLDAKFHFGSTRTTNFSLDEPNQPICPGWIVGRCMELPSHADR